MKVVHLVQFFEPSYVGGIQRYVAELVRAQKRAGLDVSVLTIRLPEKHVNGDSPDNGSWAELTASVPIVAHTAWATFYRTPIYPSIIGDLRRLDADIVHLHGPSPWFEAALMLARPPTGRLVVTLHNSYPDTTIIQRGLGRLAKKLLKRTVAGAGAVIAPHRRFVDSLAPADSMVPLNGRLHFVPPGVDHGRFRDTGLERDPDLVLFVAHLRPEKGLHVLVDAMAMLPDLHLDVVCAVSYESRYYQRVRREAERKLGKRVRFILNAGPEALVEAYNVAACAAFPSLGLESWNLAMLEAAACGAACVRSDLPGLAWADFALTAPAGDSDATARAILEAVGRREILGREAAEVADGFSWEITCRKTVAAYKEALAGA